MNLVKMERWRDEMNWARQGKAGEKSQKGKRKKKGKRQEDNCSRYLYSISSPKTFFLVLLLAFFSRAG